ncbi:MULTISPECIES: pentapeptide repeat-containing protein [unclassified Limnothrix]|uniref:pentapeptide repeat-containing protein n=1 Tax=Limnothrix sp. FACHB-1083 TaxID=2692815 RepID=UPI0018EF7D9E
MEPRSGSFGSPILVLDPSSKSQLVIPLSCADLVGADLVDANLVGANLVGENLVGAKRRLIFMKRTAAFAWLSFLRSLGRGRSPVPGHGVA